MEERRKNKRLSAADCCNNNGTLRNDLFKIISGESTQVIGHLIDISPQGMKIVGKEPISGGTVTELVIEFPREIEGRTRVEIGTKSLWWRQVENTELCYTGFMFLSDLPHYEEIKKFLVHAHSSAVSGS
jgi:hypothetical protein